MAEVSRAAKVGLMTIVLAGAAYGGYRFVSRDVGGGNGYRVWATLPDAIGVSPQSRVMISGIQVGVVDRISLYEGQARIDIKMSPEVPLYEDAAIGKRATSLIGESFVVLTPGTEGKPRIPDEGRILHYIDEPTVQSMQGQVAEILKDVKAVTEALRNSVGSDSGEERLTQILDNLADVTEQLNETVRENRASVTQTINNISQLTGESAPRLREILRNVEQVTRDIRTMTAAAEVPGRDGKPGELRSAAERLGRASESLESALKHADNVAARVDRGEGTLGRLTRDETLINEVETVVEDVGELVGGINRFQTVVGLRTDYNFLANTIKSYVELRLQPTEDKYYVVELVNDPRGKTDFQQIDVDTTNPNEPAHYREVRTITTNAFRFSFQFAKRLGPFTGRFGIKESTGGLGLDLHLLDDRFELRQDLFGFGEELSPRWRVALAYEFIRKLWLLGGMDDILNSDRRDYFVGLQLRFNDADLKTVLPFAPTSF
ncbi:ABC organic solvent transporter solute-binding substrate-binding protein [Sorangium cellulosum]|uniref:ABC organic solvent transporter solute-binding substrate-binding protein n=2 Tax=Polyangiaceae TaxID=49 RepID=A0A4P2Q9G2_SORCE|nr:ABC organic solvent transporter solute-binding substrate-binding protein [Sorangium cellulosum]